MSDMTRAAAIFAHHTSLKEALSELQANGFKDISVLVKHETDREESGDEVRPYSTATYPTQASPTQVVHAKTDPNHVITDQEIIQRGTLHASSTATEPNLHARNTIVRNSEDAHAIDENIKREYDISTKDPNAFLKDTTIGGVIGALAGAAALLIPGVGAVLAAGPVAMAIGAVSAGGAAGMTAGALAGILQDEGLPQERVSFYRNAFKQGKAIVIVEPKGEEQVRRVRLAREILNHYDPDTLDIF